MTNDKNLEQLRRQILAVLDGIERQNNTRPRTSQMRKICKIIIGELSSLPPRIREQIEFLLNDSS